MLAPHDRSVLWKMLRPPQGYRVDQAIATTFSLDLLALLTAPLAFSLFERLAEPTVTGPDGGKAAAIEPTALLAAVREHADRLTVFCQAGRICAPGRYRPLLAYLEGSVVQVKSRSEKGVFHPKLWILRMTHPEAETIYRVVVATRNLTFDRSWDTALVLEGPLVARARAFARNHPLADLIADLPALALQEMDPKRREAVATIAEELRRVDLEVPAPFEEMAFHPIGLARRRPDPMERSVDRMLIVSPFLAESRLEHLIQEGEGHVLVSRSDQLAAIDPATLRRFASVHVLADGAEGDDEEDAQDAPGATRAELGLHAKLYVGEVGKQAHVWTGSANASDAAFEHNVELLVELSGPRRDVGIDALLGDGGASLRNVLAPFGIPDAVAPADAVAEALDRRIDAMRKALSSLAWTVEVTALEGTEESFELTVSTSGDVAYDIAVATRLWPITLSPEYAQPLSSVNPRARFRPCSFAALTSFLAIEVTARVEEQSMVVAFAVPCTLVGAPPQRLARILQTFLDDPAKVLRFLQMLLALDPEDALQAIEQQEHSTSKLGQRGSWSATPLLEALLQALDHDPERIEAFARTLDELGSTPEGAKLLPPDLDAIWPPIREVAEALRAERSAR